MSEQADADVSADAPSEARIVGDVVARARAALAAFAGADQTTVDEAVTGLAWSLYKPEHARELAELAVAETGLGNAPDKAAKNQRKTFGALRDLMRVKSVGVIEEDAARGIVKFAKPVGVVAAVTPATNPAATPVNKAMMALKGRNAIVVAPPPAAWNTTARAVALMRAELDKLGRPADLVQVLPRPASRERTAALMEAVDLVVCTGSQTNVRAAYRSGTPAIGVGLGNVPVIVDSSADLADAAGKIGASKCFDNATSCSSENSVVILDQVYEAAVGALEDIGGYRTSAEERAAIADVLWRNGKLNRELIATDAKLLARRAALAPEADNARFFMVEETGVGPAYPFSGEKLSLVLSVYRAKDFADAKARVRELLDHQGRGHSCGIHTRDPDHARELAEETDVVRVLVNQAHTFGNGGGFDNGLDFTLSMGCGTWGGNSISDNLNWRHFINVTHLVTTIPEDKPTEEELFGSYWDRHGT